LEAQVGALWHRFITHKAQRQYPTAAVALAEIEKMAGLWFRAFGGDPGLRVTAGAATRHGGRRRWLARLAGVQEKAALSYRDGETLQLPATVALFPDRALNRDLYLWLTVLAAAYEGIDAAAPWWRQNQQATQTALATYPGLQARYQHLVAAAIALRIPPERLPADEAAVERGLRQALRDPGGLLALPPSRRPPQPLPLWLYPNLTAAKPARGRETSPQPRSGSQQPQERDPQRRRAQRVDPAERTNHFLAPFRAESLLSWAEYVRVNRPTEDDPEPNAARTAEDLDVLSLSRDGANTAAKIRFDLDLPAASEDDRPLGPGIQLPEWDYRQRMMIPSYCCVQEMLSRRATPCELPPALRRDAQRLRRQFEILRPGRGWRHGQPDGEELDLDACVRHAADCAGGYYNDKQGLYRQSAHQERDLACLLLADLSMSTDAWVNNRGRVIEVIRDSLFLFSEALAVTGDRFALYGFSSCKRQHVRIHRLKTFTERYTTTIRGRINAIKPGYYTRMGAAVRHATRLLGQQTAARRLLLLLTDGKPNDLDQYEGRYGIEDTRMALLNARREGLHPFCVTIDQQADDYLPYLFGKDGFVLIHHPENLPRQLLKLYSRLTY
jgi:nitric oxide reductase NorD protein